MLNERDLCVRLSLPDGTVIDATNLKAVVTGGFYTEPTTLQSMAYGYQKYYADLEASQPDREEKLYEDKEEWSGWGDPPGTH